MHVTPIIETKRGYVEMHDISFDGGKTRIKDWLWADEMPAVNILVRKDDKFILFKQTKYALQGESLAVVGGYIETGESPLAAAKRELREELNLKTESWYKLGTYRTAVNRGGGLTSLFFADNCVNIENKNIDKKIDDPDLEKQNKITMNLNELKKALINSELKEI